MATTPAPASALPKSGAVSKGYNFASTWEQNAPLTEQQKAAIAALSHAVAERPFPANLEKSSGKDGGAAVPEKESALEEAGAMDAVLVNTHQFYKWFAELESAMKSETEEKYRLYENTLEERVNTCDGILKQVDDTLNLFEELQSLHSSVATKTKTLHDACDQLLVEKQRLIEFAEALRSRLNYFDELENGDLSIDAYCIRMKEKADELRDVGQPVSEPNLVLNLLRGLNEVYSTVTDTIAGKQPLTFADARHQLLLKELRLHNEEKVRATTALLAAASSPGGNQQQQQGSRRPNTKKGGQQPFPNSYGGFSNTSGSTSTNKRVPWGFNPWTGERVAPGERVTPPGQRRQGGLGAPGGPGAQAGRNQSILGPSPQAHTAFAPLQASSGGSNTSTSTWDAAGLIAALQNMQLQGNSPWVVDSGASTHMTSSDGSQDGTRDSPL